MHSPSSYEAYHACRERASCWWIQLPGSQLKFDQNAVQPLGLVVGNHQPSWWTQCKTIFTKILDAANNTGAAVKKRERTHRMAETKRALRCVGKNKIFKGVKSDWKLSLTQNQKNSGAYLFSGQFNEFKSVNLNF